ncbi:uncharacterized protein LOC144862388 [Branchiostoma floridae x Branchiostoma japonicum]
MSRMLAVLLAVLVTTAATTNLPSPHRLARRSAPSEDEVRLQRRANLMALLEDDDNGASEATDTQVPGLSLTEEEADALVKCLVDPVGGLRGPLHTGGGFHRPRSGRGERGDREKKALDLSSLAQSLRTMGSRKAGIILRFGKRDEDEEGEH